MTISNLTDIDLSNKRVLIRSDLNAPIKNGKIISDTRLRAALPTIKLALQRNAYVIVMSHLGNPIEGQYNINFSLQPIVDYLQKILSIPVYLSRDYLINGVNNIFKHQLIVLENVRFNIGETNNDEKLSRKYASLCDIFIMDAFGSAHRVHSSTYGVSQFVTIAYPGLLVLRELQILNKVLKNPDQPIIAVIGGAKISTKLPIIRTLSNIVNQIVVGGGIANTFIAAQGYNIGQSLYEPTMIHEAKYLLNKNNIFVPTDVYVALEKSDTSPFMLKNINSIKYNEQILDIGDMSIFYIKNFLKNASTILWNGPMGMFELTNFRKGTLEIAYTIANSKAFSIAGGGDTLSVITTCNIESDISYISTGGGSFLKFLSCNSLPAINILKKHHTINI